MLVYHIYYVCYFLQRTDGSIEVATKIKNIMWLHTCDEYKNRTNLSFDSNKNIKKIIIIIIVSVENIDGYKQAQVLHHSV